MFRILLPSAALLLAATASLAQTPTRPTDDGATPRTAEDCRGMGDEAERTHCLNSLQPNAAPTPLRPPRSVSQVPPRASAGSGGRSSTGPTNPSSPPAPPAPR